MSNEAGIVNLQSDNFSYTKWDNRGIDCETQSSKIVN